MGGFHDQGARADLSGSTCICSSQSQASPLRLTRSMSWTPFLFGKTTPLKLHRKAGLLELDLPKDALVPDRYDRRAASGVEAERPVSE